MNKSIKLITFAVLGLLLLGGSMILVIAQDERDIKPENQLISAALQDQEKRANGSLRLVYSYRDIRKADSKFKPFEYIRTDNYIKKILQITGSTQVSVYNRKKKTSRSYIRMYDKDGNTTAETGEVCNGISRSIISQPLIETSCFYYGGGFLIESVMNGTVTEEVIDGVKYFKLTFLTKDDSSKECWFDSKISFCPRRIVTTWKTGDTLTIKFDDYRNVGNDLWIPFIVDYIIKNKNPQAVDMFGNELTMRATVLTCEIGKKYEDIDLEISFPPNILVRRGTGMSPCVTP
ncbi:MAG: hypothetical protein ACYC7E_09555 [Armatimonadota bacterium]